MWNRLRLASWAFGLFLLGLVFLGVDTYSGVSRSIERVAAAAEQRVEVKVDQIKATLDRLSSDVDAQTKRVSERGGEISQKLKVLDATADTFSKRLDAMVKSLETKVAQVTKQVDNVSVRQVYPTLEKLNTLLTVVVSGKVKKPKVLTRGWS